MKLSLFLNFLSSKKYLVQPLESNRCGLDILLERLTQNKKKFEEFFAFMPNAKSIEENFYLNEIQAKLSSFGFQILQPENDSFSNSEILQSFNRSSSHYIAYGDGDTPFLDFDATLEMAEKIEKYRSDYANADGFPFGLRLELISTQIIEALIVLSQQEKAKSISLAERASLFDLIALDINSFDIETDIPDKDLSLLRVDFHLKNKLNFLLAQKIAVLTRENLSSQVICNYIDKNPEILRVIPAYYAVQIDSAYPHPCSYLPWSKKSSEEKAKRMELTQYKTLLSDISEFFGEAVIALGLWGDASFHPNIDDFIRATLEYEDFQLLIETTGIGWDMQVIDSLASEFKDRIIWIVTLDTNTPELYKEMRGEGFDEAFAFAHEISQKFGQNAYIQSVRSTQNEEDLAQFWHYWKERGQVIVQKYNSFSGRQLDKKVVDLSPIRREPCWHLKRELHIAYDGKVTFCSDDYELSFNLGNVFTEKIDCLFAKGFINYQAQCRKEYLGICGGCDEYYTFNF